jgi:flagellar hook-associated protein 2
MTTTAAAPITISGLASGLNTSSIISQLVTAESGINTGLENSVSGLQSQLAAWQSFNGDLISLQSAASSLSSASLYTAVQASTGDSTIATATSSAGATAGSHNLTINSLASAQEVLSQSFSSSSSQTGASGTISLNGKQIAITSSATLSGIANAINNAGAGVTATVLNVGTGDTRLALTAQNTGTINAISASDVSGTALESLGLVPSTGSTTSIRQLTSQNGDSVAGSLALASGTSPIGTMVGYGASGAPSGSFSIDGTAISGINLNTMSLTDVANAINQAGITGVTASVVSTSSASSTTGPQQLQITSSSGTLTSSDFSDPNGILSTLGVTQKTFADQATGAQDADFTLDNVAYVRSNNTVTDAIPDTSLDLVATGTTYVQITQDSSGISSAIQSFVSSYNAVNDYVNSQFAFSPNSADATSGTAQAAPALFGNQTLSNTQQQLSDAIDVSSGGLSLQSVGLTVGQTGDLNFDPTNLLTTLDTNPSAVANLFGQSGSATNSVIQYVGATSSTQATATGYSVDITQPASQAVATATLPSATTLSSPETLTFGGSVFSGGSVTLTLAQGNTVAQTIAQVNNDNQLNSAIVASQNSSGDLVFTSTGYGSNQNFSVSSNLSATSGTGIGETAIYGTGADVEGTINGEAATGLGQTLVGNSGNANTDGLELNVTATTSGLYGSVIVTNGVADGLNQLLNNITNASTGSIATAEAAINTSITTDQTQETANNTTISTYQSQLETEFANMETAVANLQSQGNALAAEVAGSTASSSSTSSTKTASTGTTSSSA